MNLEEIISNKLSVYEQAFDIFMESGQMPESIHPDDLLGQIMLQAINEAPQSDGEDQTWTDIIKEEILKFIEALLIMFLPIEEDYQKEKELIRSFSNGDINKKRELWGDVCSTIKSHYKREEVNLDGYIQQFKEFDSEYVFGPLVRDWELACDNQLKQHKVTRIKSHYNHFKLDLHNLSHDEYRKRKELESQFFQYPEMIEIVQMIGREKPYREDEKDDTISKYIPLLPSPPNPALEIEEVTNGKDLQHLLPIETAILADHQTESLFYYKYATGQLQLFANKPKTESRMKIEQAKNKEPRLEKGPIIVSIDTSKSMKGRPHDLAVCLLMQLLKMARKQKRNCYLISFSVNAQCLDLSKPGSWTKLNSFLSNYTSGGTDGNDMLKAGLKMLESDNYAMADVLIISDFDFLLPNPNIMQSMQEEHDKGTRFYGLQIGTHPHDYHTLLDRVWQCELY